MQTHCSIIKNSLNNVEQKKQQEQNANEIIRTAYFQESIWNHHLRVEIARIHEHFTHS